MSPVLEEAMSMMISVVVVVDGVYGLFEWAAECFSSVSKFLPLLAYEALCCPLCSCNRT